MFDSTLTMMHYNLQVDSRMLRTGLFRFGLLLGISLTCFNIQARSWTFGAPGELFFDSLVQVNYFAIVIAGFGYFAPVITEDKENRSLSLLVLSRAGSASIVLGKWLPRLFSAIAILLLQLPFVLLAITLGGVTLETILVTYAGLVSFLILIASAALFSSVHTARTKDAMFLFLCFLPVCFMGYFAVIQAVGPERWYYHSGIPLTVASMFVYGTCRVFENRPFDVEQADIGEETLTPQVAVASYRPTGRGRVWLGNPFAWKVFHLNTGGMNFLKLKIFVGALPIGIAVLIAMSGDLNMETFLVGFGSVMMFLAMVAATIELTIYLGRLFQEEIHHDLLSSLGTLPCSLGYIAYSKLAGCLIALIPAAAFFALGALCNFKGFLSMVESLFTEPAPTFFLFKIVLCLHLVVVYSLFLPRGARFAAFCTFLCLNFLHPFGDSFLFPSRNVAHATLVCLLLGIFPFMHFFIGRHLRHVAGR